MAMLLSGDSDSPARTAAQEINIYYWDRNLESGALFKFQKEAYKNISHSKRQ